jgi:hypothetical protein
MSDNLTALEMQIKANPEQAENIKNALKLLGYCGITLDEIRAHIHQKNQDNRTDSLGIACQNLRNEFAAFNSRLSKDKYKIFAAIIYIYLCCGVVLFANHIAIKKDNYILPKAEWQQIKEKSLVWAYVERNTQP